MHFSAKEGAWRPDEFMAGGERQMLPAGGIPVFPAWDFNSTNRNIPFHYMLKGGLFTLRIYPCNSRGFPESVVDCSNPCAIIL